jgi:hypothetical protein
MKEKISGLPLELFFYIREFLLNSTYEVPQYMLDGWYLQENERGWRNLLSASNRENWKSVRKRTMIWSLNQFESKRLIDDEENYASLRNKMFNVKEQLRCNLISNFNDVSLNTKNIGYLSLQNYCELSLPSSDHLHTLILRDNKNLKTIGSYPNLTVLIWNVFHGPFSFECLDSLKIFQLDCHYSVSMEQFPMEKITSLFIDGTNISEQSSFHAIKLVDD